MKKKESDVAYKFCPMKFNEDMRKKSSTEYCKLIQNEKCACCPHYVPAEGKKDPPMYHQEVLW